MIDSVLSWFGRLWIGTLVLANIYLSFALPDMDVALFHVGWAPVGALPSPGNMLWTAATVVTALPGIGALVLRDQLRKRAARK